MPTAIREGGNIKIAVMPHKELKEFISSETKSKIWVILVDNTDEKDRNDMSFFNQSVTSCCHVIFDDEEDGTNAMSEHTADIVAHFVRNALNIIHKKDPVQPDVFMPSIHYANQLTLIVSCKGGVSRSPAIAAAIGDFLGYGDDWIFDNGHVSPNEHVFRTLSKAFGINEDEASIQGKFEHNFEKWRQIKIANGEL